MRSGAGSTDKLAINEVRARRNFSRISARKTNGSCRPCRRGKYAMKCLFVVLDTVRRDYLEAYGNTWVKTPNLARLARSGVTFDNHWVGSLPCMPARREFMTGRHNFLFRGWGPIEPYDDTLLGELRKRDIFTHLLTDHDHYFELGGENYHTAFNTWEFFRGQEHDPWISLVDRLALPEHMGQLSPQNWHNRAH